MKKRFLSLLCVLALCLGLLPVTALAAGEDKPGTLWVGQTQITASGYWKTNADGKLEPGSESAYNVYYDGNGTLTLNNATIQGRGYSGNPQPEDYGIYAAPTGNQSVSLTINLMGSNTVSGYCGICVETTTADNASLVIQPAENDPQGSLEAIGNKYNGITISSGSGNASLTINNAPVVAISKSPAPNSYHGVCIKTGIATAPALSLLVNGGSLTAQGESGYGIYFYMRDSTTDPSTSLTVQNNALVKATPSIVTSNNLSKPDTTAGSESGGIVFDGKNGTVYGDVELQDDLEIGTDETLTIPDGSSLDTNGNLTNSGTIINNGTLTGEVGGSGTVTPKITTDSLPNGTVGESYTATLEATGNNITWSASGLPDGLTLNESTGTISGTPTKEGTFNFTVTATNSAGNASKEYTLNIKSATVPVTRVTLNPSSLSLFTGGSETLTATVEPGNATNKNVTWSSSNEAVATVDTNGKVTAVGEGNATITATAEENRNISATCTVTVTQSTYSISADTKALDFGSAYTGYTQPAAKTVTITNDGNQQVTVTLPTANDFIITAGTGFTNGSAAINPGGTATFTVQPKAGLSVGTYSKDITVTSSQGATVTITASFTVKQYSGGSSDPTYSVSLPSQVTGGSVTATKRYAEKGETFRFTVTPDEGYELDTLTVTDRSGKKLEVTDEGDGVYSFKMPAGRVEIEVSFREIAVELPFTDVPEDAWYADAAAYVYEHGLMAGTSATTFAPDATTSRSMIATILWRMAGSPVVNYAMDYTDVAQGQWYSEAIRWAASEGIVGGYGNGLFGTNDPITREQFAAMLYRFAQEQGYDVSIGENTNILSYTDVADLSEYAISAMQWAVGAGIINGTGDGSTLSPQGQATRAQAAVMLMRFCEEYVTW